MKTDILIVGCGVAGLYCALNLPADKNITIITKANADESDSFLAQGGICVLRDENDFDSFYEDTMRAGHYENNPDSVTTMIVSSRDVISDLVGFGVRFEKAADDFAYTKEGAHSKARILYHADETGKEITSHLLERARERKNITLIENYTMVDLIIENDACAGVIGHDANYNWSAIHADYTVLATGGIGGLYQHSTNFPHLTGDALALSLKHDIKLQNIDYIQIHPTTLFSKEPGRAFLISESVRGEGAILLNSKGERFVDELLPRDVVTKAIYEEMAKEGTEHVWLSLEPIPTDVIRNHFPNIYDHCLSKGYDITKEKIPVVPSQHYFMGGVDIDLNGKTSMDRLYAVGETACNGVHGKNRLASNSLLEGLVFAKRSANHIMQDYTTIAADAQEEINSEKYNGYAADYKESVLAAIERSRKSHE